MEILELGLLLLGAVLLSSLLEPLLPRVSLPLVQIAIGVLIALFVHLPADIAFDSDLFLVVFIAPLLFDESRNADKRALWVNKKSILSLAIGLVIVSVFAIGFTLHWLVPSIPLAAAFAVGAALGPTDAVAVASLGKDISLTKRQKAQLSGEALLNDASGVVSFKFAIAAVATGAFSVTSASATFALEFFGGVILGLIVGAVFVTISRRMRGSTYDNVTTHVLFELCLPFFTYLLAEMFGVSGILAVVAAGLIITFAPLPVQASATLESPQHTRTAIVSDSVWEVLSFVLNGLIFLLLGLLLPELTEPVLSGMDVTSLRFVWLVGVVAAVTFVMYALRFIWLLVMDFFSDNAEAAGGLGFGESPLRRALVTTLAGAKGAVAVAIAFTMPLAIASTGEAFPQRSLLIFIVCGVCVISLLIANFVVPLLAPRGDEIDEDTADAEVEILSNVIEGLRDRKNKDNAEAIAAVVRTYQRRIGALRKRDVSARQLRTLRLDVLGRQKEHVEAVIEAGNIDERTGQRYLRRIARLERRMKRSGRTADAQARTMRPLAVQTTTFSRVAGRIANKDEASSLLDFKIGVEEVAVHYLEAAARSKDEERSSAAKALLAEHRALMSALKQRKRFAEEAARAEAAPKDIAGNTLASADGKQRKERVARRPKALITDIQAEALRLELEQIQRMRKKGKISSAAARDMRQDVYLIQMGLVD